MNDYQISQLERMLVSGCVQDHRMVLVANLEAEDFLLPQARALWPQMVELARAGGWVGMNELAIKASADDDGRRSVLRFLESCEDTVGCPESVPRLAEGVRGHSVTRAALRASESAQELVRAGYEGEDLVTELIRRLSAHRMRLSRRRSRTGKELGAGLLGLLDGSSEESHSRYVPIGLARIDEITGGWQGGVVSLIGARTSHGKSSFLLQCAVHAARLGFPVHLLSAEDLEADTGWRILSQISGLPARQLRRYKSLAPEEIIRVLERRNELEVYERIRITPTSGLGAEQIVAQVRLHQHQDKTALVLVDYLQRLPVPAKLQRYEVYTQAMATFDEAAKEDGLPWVVASQFRRSKEARPELSDFRDAGSIEEVGKLALSLYRPRFGQPNDDEVIVSVLKSSNGDTGEGRFVWDGPRMAIVDRDPQFSWGMP